MVKEVNVAGDIFTKVQCLPIEEIGHIYNGMSDFHKKFSLSIIKSICQGYNELSDVKPNVIPKELPQVEGVSSIVFSARGKLGRFQELFFGQEVDYVNSFSFIEVVGFTEDVKNAIDDKNLELFLIYFKFLFHYYQNSILQMKSVYNLEFFKGRYRGVCEEKKIFDIISNTVWCGDGVNNWNILYLSMYYMSVYLEKSNIINEIARGKYGSFPWNKHNNFGGGINGARLLIDTLYSKYFKNGMLSRTKYSQTACFDIIQMLFDVLSPYLETHQWRAKHWCYNQDSSRPHLSNILLDEIQEEIDTLAKNPKRFDRSIVYFKDQKDIEYGFYVHLLEK